MNSERNSKRAYVRRVIAAAAVAACMAPVAKAVQAPVFDNISPTETTNPVDAYFYYTTPNPSPTGRAPDNAIADTVMGDAYTVPVGTTNITGVDLYFANATNDPSLSSYSWYNGGSGTTYNALKIITYVWGTVTPSPLLNASNPALSATNPAFSNLLGTNTYIDKADTTAPDGYIYGYEGDGVSNPGIEFNTPIALNGATTIGISFAIEGSTDGGLTYNFNSGLTPIVLVNSPASVGSQQLQAFYINDSGETNGNFTQGPHYFAGNNSDGTPIVQQGIADRIYAGSATIFQWTSSGGGNFATTGNFSPNGTPTLIDTVQFNLSSPAASPYTVSFLQATETGTVNILNDNVIFDMPSYSSQIYFSNTLTVGQSTTASGTTHGTLQLTNSANAQTNLIEAGNIVVGGNGGTGTLTIGQGVYAYSDADTSIAANSQIIIQQYGALRTGTLTFAGTANAPQGQLDIGSSDMIVRNGSIGTIMSELKSGYNKGAWNGQGIISSAAAADSTHLTAVGAIVNNDGNGNQIYGNTSSGTLGLFGGTNPAQTVGDNPNLNAVLIKYTYYGDANLDGVVDGSDYSLIDNGFLKHLTGWYNGDFNYDGVVDGSDYTLIDNAFNNQSAVSGVSPLGAIDRSSSTSVEHLWSPSLTQLDESASGYGEVADASASITSQIATTVVPEPATFGLVAMGGIALLGRKAKRLAH